MNPVGHLGELRRVAGRRALRLRALVDPVGVPVSTQEDRLVAFVTIEALNLWSSFARSFFLSCVFKARRESGARVSHSQGSLVTTELALTFAIRVMKPSKPGSGPWQRRDEPTWFDVQTLLKLFPALGASNAAQVVSAFSYPTKVFQHLPTARNFFAHRNVETSGKVSAIARAYSVAIARRASDVFCSRSPARPQSVLADWLDDIRNVVDIMCQ